LLALLFCGRLPRGERPLALGLPFHRRLISLLGDLLLHGILTLHRLHRHLLICRTHSAITTARQAA
jgi:hypothetical protein